MIKEQFVEFETAKLLKEKGFDELCFAYYEDDGTFRKSRSCIAIRNMSNLYFFGSAAPTQCLTIRWLREVHNLSVEVNRTACGYIGAVVAIPSGTDIVFLDEDGDDKETGQYTTWEKAAEAGIKHCLLYLI